MKLDRRQVCVVTLSSASELTMLTLGERVMMRKRFSFAVLQEQSYLAPLLCRQRTRGRSQ
jgi:hypothetical protein